MRQDLFQKYDKPVPRYTSFPAVPHWDIANFTAQSWLQHLKKSFSKYPEEGISLYIHLPYCERLCTYCGCNKHITTNHAVEDPYIDAVLHEWKMYLEVLESKPLLRGIHLGGGTPTFFSAKNLERLLSGILSTAYVSADFEGSVEVHPTVTSFEQLAVLHNLGFSRLSAGVQDTDPVVQFIINRVQPNEETIRVVTDARNIGFQQINIDLVYGLPLQTFQSIQNTLKHVLELSPDRIAYYGYAHVPWKSKGQRRYSETDLPSVETKRTMYLMANEVLTKNDYHAIGMDHFAKPEDPLFLARAEGRLHRNFMGYTTQNTPLMIGLGASAISDCETAYSQNYKTPKEYLAILSQKTLPVEKGHILSQEDLQTKKHILNLMCYYQTCTNTIEDKEQRNIIQNRLSEMVADELLVIDNQDIKISPIGHPFVRNIAACFDPYFNKQANDTPTFSKSI